MSSYEANYEAMNDVSAPGMAELRTRVRKDRFGLTNLDEQRQTTRDKAGRLLERLPTAAGDRLLKSRTGRAVIQGVCGYRRR